MEAVGRNGFLDLAESERRLCVWNSVMDRLFHFASNSHGGYECFEFSTERLLFKSSSRTLVTWRRMDPKWIMDPRMQGRGRNRKMIWIENVMTLIFII